MRNLFVPFFTTKDKGTGLGLAISQRLVQGAGGSIQVHTVPDGGSTFTVVLPVAELASRAKRVVERRRNDSPVMGVFFMTTPAKADAVIATDDATARCEAQWKRELTEGKGAVAVALKRIQGWLPLLVRDIPDFSSTELGDRPSVPDDVIADLARLRDVVSDASGRDRNPLPYRDGLLADIDPVLRAAEQEWAQADAADKQYQALTIALRAAGDELERELIALRKHAAVQFGRNDRDYQKLRIERASERDEEDDPWVSVALSSSRGEPMLLG